MTSLALSTDVVLSVNDLVVQIDTQDGPVDVLQGVSFELRRNEVLSIVGESGSGKSMTALAVMGLLPRNARITGGRVELLGQDLRGLTTRELNTLRGNKMAIVFQDATSALNPLQRVGSQLVEAIREHRPDLSRTASRQRAIELLRSVHVPNPQARARSYPHEFSGGMRQRAVIAMAIAHSPALLIADEPTTALDATTQAQVLQLLAEVRRDVESGLLLITHDIGVVAETAHRVLVMYSGRVVESGTVDQVLEAPRHPYTRALLASRRLGEQVADRALSIPGQPPALSNRPSGCAFNPRCPHMAGRRVCVEVEPPLVEFDEGNARCHFPLVSL